ncbi:hypothetical protein [Kitasatospora mediocidica]|uniref:hypothetical protein n=1 Tax=Kitasatospora mediocidica TaxID=58352 RepID=UPI00068CE452|nr:hypothetical protein [Kitasatospora mediocidica]
MIRAAVPSTVAALALAACAVLTVPTPAAAHGGNIHFAITARSDGHTRATASYDDGDPVDEPLGATLSALSSDGRSVGPWPLLAVSGAQATYTTRESLPPGSWKVSVDAAFPELGHGESEVAVTAVPDTQSPPSQAAPVPASSPTAPPAPDVAAPARQDSAGALSLVLVLATVALGVLGVAAAAVMARRRRPRPS